MAQVAAVAARYAARYAVSSANQQPSQPITVSERDKQLKIIGYLAGGVIVLLLFIFMISKLEFFSTKKNNSFQNSINIQRLKTMLIPKGTRHYKA